VQEPEIESHNNKSSLPILVGLQLVITILTLSYVAYNRFSQEPTEYPVVIVKPVTPVEYGEKNKGKVTVFDLVDISEWARFNDPEASTSSKSQVSFIYPPNFDIKSDPDNTIHLSQNNKDFLVVSQTGSDITESQIPSGAKEIHFTARKKFYQYDKIEPKKSDALNANIDIPVVYQGGINGYGLTLVDTGEFSPEVIYLILMSMEYVE
jgi:hypothetical protein